MDIIPLQLSVPLVDERYIVEEDVQLFRTYIYDIYAQYGRSLPWRHTEDPYHVLVSEIMLQQTQVHRVIVKYHEFLARFPTLNDLATATLRDVLAVWIGLGYNRRGAALYQAAQIIVDQHEGKVPQDSHALVDLPGIGANTVGSIQAFAFNMPSVFIETNIRSVFLHTWFRDEDNIHDRLLIPIIQQTLDAQNARVWYYALMDYGALLKKYIVNPSRKSKHYSRQSKFEGSDRQIRGIIIRQLTLHPILTWQEIMSYVQDSEERVQKIMQQLLDEELVHQTPNSSFMICNRTQF